MPNSFTPQQIEQFLQEFFDVVGARQYIGARYVPIFGRSGEDTVEWDDGAPYEPLTVVMHLGVSYVSRRYVPTGIQITDTDYWVETYRFNAQVEQYRQEVLSFQGQIDRIREDMESDYVPFPDPDAYPKYGTTGQVLSTLSNGETKWEDPVVPSDAQAEEVITAWLTAHPEATTTVQNNSLTKAKFVPTLRDEINGDSANINATYTFGLQGTIQSLTFPTNLNDPIVFSGSNNSGGKFGFITFNGQDHYCKLPTSPWSVNIPRYSFMCFSTTSTDSTIQIKTVANLDETDVVLLGYAMYPGNSWASSFTGVLYERISTRKVEVLGSIGPTVDGNSKNINATYTFGLQGSIQSLTFPTNLNDPIVFSGSNNSGGNFGFITFNGQDHYCKLPTSPWSVNIPRYSVLCFSTATRNGTVEVKTITSLGEHDVVLLGYAMNPGNSWVSSFTGVLYDRIESLKTTKLWESYEPLKNNDKTMRSICRFGEGYGQPESAAAILACNNAGFSIVRLNLQFTSDGVAVLWHDQSLNQHYHNVYDSNDELVPYSVDDNVRISDTTKAQLDQYKYGGVSYAPGIPTLDAALKQCRKLGMEVVLEGKMEYTTAQLATLKTTIDRYGMMGRISIAGLTNANAIAIATALPKLRVGIQSNAFNTSVSDTYVTLSGIADRLFWWGWTTMELTSTIVEFLSQYGIEYECGSFASLGAIDAYLGGDFAWYCTGMEVNGSVTPLIGQHLANA